MPELHDGPRSPLFRPLPLRGNATFEALGSAGPFTEEMVAASVHAPQGACTCWGIPFEIGQPCVLHRDAVSVEVEPFPARYLVFLHTTDTVPLKWNRDKIVSPMSGAGRLAEAVADYVVWYDDGTQSRQSIRRRHQIGMYTRRWGECGFECVAHRKPHPVPAVHEQVQGGPFGVSWGQSQTRVAMPDWAPWIDWVYAWENPHPDRRIVGLRLEPRTGIVVVSAITAGDVSSHPLRWQTRRTAIVRMGKGEGFDPALDDVGQSRHARIDLGQVIQVQRRPDYRQTEWGWTYNNKLPVLSETELLVHYTAHPDAQMYLPGGEAVPIARLEADKARNVTSVAPATRRVRLRVVERGTNKPIAVKLHIHGEAGEYLPPVDRSHIVNPAWFEDYGPEFVHQGLHPCAYINGEATLDLPVGTIYVELSKGFEIRPFRKVLKVTPAMEELVIPLDRVLPWRERGWVTADTHVHFLSPKTALLEGEAEGVNVVNLLASQWGGLMTNVGDFDGHTTFGSKENGGDGEWLVRVGTENRQHVLGHISLLGYAGQMIAPMCAGGPDEAALGSSVEVLLTEWARQCRVQGGLVVLPHFPNPRAEHAATMVEGEVDAVEMTSWGDLYGGIDPYSLSDWYRYLNCGYFVPAVGGTDKMAASTAVGTIRTYAHLPADKPFTYQTWMEAIRSGNTFVTYGPLIDFQVEGKPAGSWFQLGKGGGHLAVHWEVGSVTVPVSRIELIVNGVLAESRGIRGKLSSGVWNAKVPKSSWIALRVRGHYPGKPEMVAAHTSPVMARVEGSEFFAAADAVTILDQIEGALAFLDTVGTRAETRRYQEMRLVLTSAYRKLHNRLHSEGQYHAHTAGTDHQEHHD